MAVLATMASLLIRWPLQPLLEDAVPHMTFFPAVMVAAYFGGFWPGVLATILGAVAANFVLTEPLRSFHGTPVKDGAALTPPLESGLLPGITREFVFEVGAERKVAVHEAVLHDDDLFGADEAFLTSTTREVVPIVQVDDRRIGAGVPGPITRALLDGFRRKAQALTKSEVRTQKPLFSSELRVRSCEFGT